MSVPVKSHGIRRWRADSDDCPHHVRIGSREILPDGVSAHAQLLGDAPNRHSPVPGIVDRVPPGTLTLVGLVTCSDYGLEYSIARYHLLIDRCRAAVSTMEHHSVLGTVSGFGPGDNASEGSRFRRGLLRRDDASVVEHSQTAVQTLEHLHPGPGVACTSIIWRQLQGVPLVPQRVVPCYLPRVLVAEDPVEVYVGTERTVGLVGFAGRDPEPLVEAWQEALSTLSASAMVEAPARRSSVTSLSWNVPAMRSTLPLA